MKVLLGAHGVGKTTLLNEIIKIRKDVYTTDAFSRPIRKIAEKTNMTAEQVQLLNTELMISFMRHYSQFSFVITGRSIIDSIIYSRLLSPELDISEVEQELWSIKDKIQYAFYIPIEFPLEDDGVRYNAELQQRFDQEIHNIIKEFHLQEKVITIQGTLQQRTNEILKWI